MHHPKILTLLLLLSLGHVLSPARVLAQPSRIEQQLPPVTPPSKQPDFTIPKREELTAPEGADQQTFQLNALIVEGSTIYSPEDFLPFYGKFLGKEVSLKDLYDIANRITRRYRNDGYILSLAIIPEQTVAEGTARIQVIEGYIEAVEFDGPPQQVKRLKGFGDKIKASQPVNIKDLERYLLLANDMAGVEVRAILRRGDQLGTAVLLARVIYDNIDPFFDITNRGTDEVGPVRLQAGIFLNSLLGQGERITFRGATTPVDQDPHELALGSLDISIPVGHEGLRFDVGTSYTDVQTGLFVGGPGRTGGTTVTGRFAASYPIIRSRATNIFVNGGFDYADSRNVIARLLPTQDQLQVLRAGVQLEKVDGQGVFTASAQVSQGIGGDTVNPLRMNAGPIFTKGNLEFSRLQRLPAQLSFLFTSKAQFSGDTLLVREQFGLGGATFGSAFEPDQRLGDYGYGFRVELQRTWIHQLLGRTNLTQPYIYADVGQVFRNTTVLPQRPSALLSSAGIGVRHTFGESISAAVELGIPIEDTGIVPLPASEPRVFFTVTGFY